MRPTAEQLRDVAWALDALSKLTRALYEPIAAMDELNVSDLEITVGISRESGQPLTPEDAQTLMEWVASEEMQEDLRAWADDLESPSIIASDR